MKRLVSLVVISLLGFSVGCRTKSELRREQELEKLKTEVKEARDVKVDVETTIEELRAEIARLSGLVEQQASQLNNISDEMKSQMGTLTSRAQAIEQKQSQAQQQAAIEVDRQTAAETKRNSYEVGKSLFEEAKYEQAVEVLRAVTSNPASADEAKKAQFLLGDACFGAKDYASAALEFAEFRKSYPKDPLVPNAIYKQATSFKNMGKKQEAKLFFQDLIDRYPTSSFSARAKSDIRKIK